MRHDRDEQTIPWPPLSRVQLPSTWWTFRCWRKRDEVIMPMVSMYPENEETELLTCYQSLGPWSDQRKHAQIWGHDQYLGYSEGLSPWIYLTFVREPAFKCAGWLHRVSDRSVPASESPSTLRIEILTPVIYRSVNHRSILAFLVEKEFKINLLVSAYDHQGEERETGRLTKRSMELFTLSKRRLLPDDTWQTFRRCRTQFGKGKYL